jgi:signal transduction histidine kinase/CheY-like chemotaxis protein
LVWFTFESSRKSLEDATLLISEAKTQQILSSMSVLYKSMDTSLQNISSNPRVTALFENHGKAADESRFRSEAADWFESIIQGSEYYRDILVLDKNGICIVSSNPGHVGNSFENKEYVRQALKGGLAFGELSVGLVSKKFNAVAAYPVDTSRGIEGALVIFNDFPKIVDYDADRDYGNRIVTTSLLAPDGIFVAHSDKRLMGNTEKTFTTLYQQLVRDAEYGGRVHYSLLGERHVGYGKLEPVSGWMAITSGMEKEVFAPAYRTGTTVLGISFGLCFFISLLIVYIANTILTTLLSLIRYAKRVSDGDLKLELQDTRRTDELGVLHSALQRLVLTLRAMLAASMEASKMKGNFLANMSHEIRTPLNAIIGMTHLSLRNADLMPAKQRDYLDKIQLAAKSLLGLINDILDLSKIEAGRLELDNAPFNLRQTMTNILDIHLENAKSKGLSLTMEYGAGTPENFVGDSLRVGQVLNNLLSNAIKFTKTGGVSVQCLSETPESEEPGDRESAVLRVNVTDTGIGMPENVVAGLFQPFTQADASIARQFGGTGLGLDISNKIVKLLGGAFTVRSEPGTGTTFSFTMRLAHGMTNERSETENASSCADFARLNLEGKRILVAEDNLINQMIMEELLAPSKATIVMVGNGGEAVAAVKADKFNLVFMDMQMPEVDGLEATRRIRAFLDITELPIIAITANAMKEDREQCLAGGMNGYITKPIEPEHLFDVLREYLCRDSAVSDVSLT